MPDDLLKGVSLDVFQHQVTVFVLYPHIQQVDYVMMSHQACGMGLPLKPLQKLVVAVVFALEDFHGHAMAGTDIGALYDELDLLSALELTGAVKDEVESLKEAAFIMNYDQAAVIIERLLMHTDKNI